MWLFWSGGGSAADGKVPFCVFNMHFFPAVHFQAGNLLSFQTPISIISPAMTAFICTEMNAAKFPRNSRGPVGCPPPRGQGTGTHRRLLPTAHWPAPACGPARRQRPGVLGTCVCWFAHPVLAGVCAAPAPASPWTMCAHQHITLWGGVGGYLFTLRHVHI